jgi:N-acetylglutamate synthase-like GNAT family acetyltransferase
MYADDLRPEIRKYLRRGELWLASHKGKIVACMVLLETRIDVVEIMNIAVIPELRSKGIGTQLLKFARRRAKQLGAHRLEVGTDNGGLNRIQFYQRFGFRIFGADVDYFVHRFGGKVYRRNGIALRDMIRMAREV